MNTPDTFKKAMRLLREKPLRPDILERLDALKEQTPEEFREFFDEFYEAAIAAS